MADPVEPVVVAPVTEAAPVAPVVETPVADVVQLVSEVPSLFEAPIAEPVSEVVPEKPAAEVIEAALVVEKPVEEKPAADPEKPAAEADPAKVEAKVDPEKPVVEAKPVEAPKPEPVEYEYKAPEGVVMDEATDKRFRTVLDEFRADPKAGGQKLLDLYAEKTAEMHDNLLRDQHKAFIETRDGWKKQIMADPEIGGSGHQTAITAAARMRDMFASDHPTTSKEYAQDMKDLNDFMRITGAGDHPVFVKIFHRIAQRYDEPALPPAGAKPVLNGGMPKGAGSMYTNPRSPQPRG